MSASERHVQQALQNIELIRRAIEGLQAEESQLARISAPGVQILVIGAACAISTLLFLLEILLGDFNTHWLLSQHYQTEMQRVAILEIGFFLIVILLGLYFIVWRASEHQGEKLNEYIARNFVYLKNFAFIWDLFVKFTLLSLIILAGKPEWTAPLLFLFTADYCIQGRFFILPLRLSYILGMFCVVGAAIQFVHGSPFLLWPHVGFSTVALFSLGHIWKNSRAKTQ